MRFALLTLLALFVSGCATKDPFKDAYWAKTAQNQIALCVNDKRCFTPSQEDMEYYKSTMCLKSEEWAT